MSRADLMAAGLTPDAVRARLASGRWQRFHRGIYVTHNGPLARSEMIDGVLAAAGDGATLSHTTAAELSGLTDDVTTTVHVSIPSTRRIAAIRGALIHYSSRIGEARHPTKRPARTRIEETVLDLAEIAERPEDAVGWLAAACGRRLTTPDRIAVALERRNRSRWRRHLADALADVARGNHSVLEVRYFRAVECAHSLPDGDRQAPHRRAGGQIFDDVRYARFRTVVELDGRLGHPVDDSFRDLRRDNIAGERGDVVLHYGWTDVANNPCAVAIQVGTALQRAGWAGPIRPCGRSCVIQQG